MGKYYGTSGKRIGKVGNEKYYINRGQNIVQASTKYKPINSSWIKQEEFKQYILSLIGELKGNIIITDILPSTITNNTLYFVKNNDYYDIYVDYNDERTKININGSSSSSSDYVDVVDTLPSNKNNNTIYFVKDNTSNRNNNIYYKLYVYEDDTLKEIELNNNEEIVSNIETINGNINTINSNINTLQTKVDNNTSTIDDIVLNIGGIERSISNINTEINTFETNTNTRFNTLTGSVTTNSNNITTINSNISTINTNVSNLDTKFNGFIGNDYFISGPLAVGVGLPAEKIRNYKHILKLYSTSNNNMYTFSHLENNTFYFTCIYYFNNNIKISTLEIGYNGTINAINGN